MGVSQFPLTSTEEIEAVLELCRLLVRFSVCGPPRSFLDLRAKDKRAPKNLRRND